MDALKEIIRRYCEKYELEFYENFILEVVTDISEYI